MSSSVVSPAQWGAQLPHNPPIDSAPTGRRARAISTKMVNGNTNGDAEKKNPQSISPVPTTSTRSTRSRRNVAYGESDSPDLPPVPLPSVSASKPVSKKKKPTPKPRVSSAKMVKTASTNSAKSLLTQSSTSPSSSFEKELPEIGEVVITQQPSVPAPKSEFAKTITPESVKADLPPSTSTSTLKISFKTTANGGIKRLASSQDPIEDDASTTYDFTPRVSPTPDAATINGDQVEVQGEDAKDAPKRAPRKKRKWLKRGEVDPDDPIAVAKQQERFALLDQADELLEQQMEAVRNGTYPGLLGILTELESRKNVQLEYANQRHEFKNAEILKTKQQGQTQARVDHHEASEKIQEDIRTDLRRDKHALVNERLQISRTPDSYPILQYGRGSRGWPLHTKRLISNQQQAMVQFEIDGQVHQRKDHDVKLSIMSSMDARADLELFRQPIPGSETPPSPEPRRSIHIAKAESPRRVVAGPSRPPAASSSQTAGPSRNQIWGKGVYDVKDLPTYQAGSGSIPMRQTPTHSPTPTPSRRPSPPPPAVVRPQIPRLPTPTAPGSIYTTLTNAGIINGTGPTVPRAPHPQNPMAGYGAR